MLTERGSLLLTAGPTGSAGGTSGWVRPCVGRDAGDRDPAPRSVSISAVTQTERGGQPDGHSLTPRAVRDGRRARIDEETIPGGAPSSPRSVCVTIVSDPSACSLAGLRPSHQRGTPPLLPERSAVVAAFDRGGSDQFEPGTNAQRGSGTSYSERTGPLRRSAILSGCRPGSILNDKARAAHLCGERRAGQGGTS